MGCRGVFLTVSVCVCGVCLWQGYFLCDRGLVFFLVAWASHFCGVHVGGDSFLLVSFLVGANVCQSCRGVEHFCLFLLF